MLTKKVVLAAASSMLAATLVFAAAAQPAYATSKVDCDAVMNEVNSGKHAKDIAKDLNISTSSVYRCKKHAKEAAKASTKSQSTGFRDGCYAFTCRWPAYEAGRGGVGSTGGGSFEVEIGEVEICEVGIGA